MDAFFRYPHTPHLAWLGANQPRDDKVLSPAEATELLDGEVTVEEKLDGANLGISMTADGSLRAQNRGQYLHEPFSGQFSKLHHWLMSHEASLKAALRPGLIAFGEWCAARHSLNYSALPDWWLLFDIYDRDTHSFWHSSRRNEWAAEAGVRSVVAIAQGRFTLQQLKELLIESHSQYRDGSMEGIVIRKENPCGVEARAKLVRPDFVQGIEEHWRKRPIQWNRLGTA